jgi:putative peptidoglycan lipid II flippase
VVAGDLLYGLVLLPLESRLVWLVLLGSSVGLLSNTSSRLLQSALYADGDSRTPAQYAMVRVVLATAFGALLMLQFDRLELTSTGIALRGALPAFTPLPPSARATDPASALRLGAVGLALAAGSSSWLEYALLRRHLARRRNVSARVGGGVLTRTMLAGVVAGIAGVAVRVLSGGPLVWRLSSVAVTIGGVYLLAARVLGLSEVSEFLRLVSGRRHS